MTKIRQDGRSRRRAAARSGWRLVLAVAVATPSVSALARQEPPAPPASLSELLRRTRSAIDEGRLDEAAAGLEALQDRLPDVPQLPYNLGVARYRAGDYVGAAEAFRRALDMADDRELREASLFNLGNAAHARAREALEGGDDPAAAGNQLQDATERLGEAFDHYRDALRLDPTDQDARANAELTWRLLKQLEQLQQQMQQQQGDQQQDQQQQEGDQQQQG
ncbi:MAG: tetratricopeptide repeat protein, partial [Planctomycetota bacterium]